ncbi:MazG nucleotide pyrophosphohydrolase domain-containing protein [Actinopolymorpha singaporensis]|uniref:XTP/dITP diphosphohydrolase n=1 Tax=Actinopolymorpha singaporensis TaxID=117157 RepID=A0A1H1L112_9ACTN|nr:MazG nucleotide pyrophosphohydrolase domain-containing protein [Actinopolymorpha singaporensis]SDR67952.1 XTP/dITP diphosphohydrolase [Actinopolymorpha singaporensis]SDT27474.1 XTP/dITP diphosphohydrolase [Actinopolymorpha singaporensis]
MTAGRIALLLTSPRVAPGLLAWPAWELLHAAGQVLTDDADHPQRAAVEAAGVRVLVVEDAPGPGELADLLVTRARAGVDVVWLAADDGDPALGRALGHLLATAAEAGTRGLPTLEVVPASYDLPGARLLDLVSVMDQLRERCPWVRDQTHRSLVRYLVEESYETVEAIETGGRQHLREELGDLLFQVVFHARLAEEDAETPFSIDDVTADLVEKLIRRNPHVFGPAAGGPSGTPESTAAEVENVWDQLKAEEKRRTSAVEGVPLALPALTLADKLLGRTRRSGVRVDGPDPGVLAEVAGHTLGEPGRLDADRLGAALLALVDRARSADLDPEQALRDACRRYVDAVRAAENPG